MPNLGSFPIITTGLILTGFVVPAPGRQPDVIFSYTENQGHVTRIGSGARFYDGGPRQLQVHAKRKPCKAKKAK